MMMMMMMIGNIICGSFIRSPLLTASQVDCGEFHMQSQLAVALSSEVTGVDVFDVVESFWSKVRRWYEPVFAHCRLSSDSTTLSPTEFR